MTKRNLLKHFKTSPQITLLAVMLYTRQALSLSKLEDFLHERGIEISHETVRFWWNSFGPLFAVEIRRKWVQELRAHSNWQWHLDGVFVKVNGETQYLWRAVDHEGAVLENYVTRRRDRKAALNFLGKTMKRFGSPHVIVTDLLWFYGAALKVIGNAALSAEFEDCINSSRYIGRSVTISTGNVTFTHATISSSTAQPLSPIGVYFVQHSFRPMVVN